jgi:beta-N-acetylhexosaminidase
VPLAEPARACYVVLAEGRYSSEGQTFVQELRKRAPKAPEVTLDPAMDRQALDDAVRKLSNCDNYAVAAFSSVAAYRGSIGLAGDLPSVVEGLIATGKPVALIAFGNPYLLRNFPNVPAYLATFSTATTSEVAAVRALFGEINITGHLPVTIPSLAQYGEGIQVQAKAVKPSGDAQ